jgi:hypothetical protein
VRVIASNFANRRRSVSLEPMLRASLVAALLALSLASPLGATHILGPVISSPATVIGPSSGLAASFGSTWQLTFSPPAAPGGTKFLLLHFTAASFPGSNRLEIDLGYDVDEFDASSGATFWSRPIEGNAVTIRYIDDGVGPPSGGVTLSEYGRGQGLQGGGEINANADFFLIDASYDDPTYQYSGGKFPPGSAPTWQNVDCLGAGVQRDSAESVGMLLWVDDGHMTSCTATLIDADLVITAGHCLLSDVEVESASITFDYQTLCNGTRPAGYDPHFHKVERLVRGEYNSEHPIGGNPPLVDYAILQLVTPPGGLGLDPVEMRLTVPPVNEPRRRRSRNDRRIRAARSSRVRTTR